MLLRLLLLSALCCLELSAEGLKAEGHRAEGLEAGRFKAQGLTTQTLLADAPVAEGLRAVRMSAEGLRTEGLAAEHLEAKDLTIEGLGGEGLRAESSAFRSADLKFVEVLVPEESDESCKQIEVSCAAVCIATDLRFESTDSGVGGLGVEINAVGELVQYSGAGCTRCSDISGYKEGNELTARYYFKPFVVSPYEGRRVLISAYTSTARSVPCFFLYEITNSEGELFEWAGETTPAPPPTTTPAPTPPPGPILVTAGSPFQPLPGESYRLSDTSPVVTFNSSAPTSFTMSERTLAPDEITIGEEFSSASTVLSVEVPGNNTATFTLQFVVDLAAEDLSIEGMRRADVSCQNGAEYRVIEMSDNSSLCNCEAFCGEEVSCSTISSSGEWLVARLERSCSSIVDSWTYIGTSEAVKRAAKGTQVAVATGVAVAVANGVATSVATATVSAASTATATGAMGAAGGAAGSAASSAGSITAGGNSCNRLLMQAQFMSISGFVGGDSALTGSARELSKSLEWVNFHMVDLPMGGYKDTNNTARRKTKYTWLPSSDDGQDPSCENLGTSKKGLTGTLITCGICLVATMVFRIFFVRTYECYKSMRGQKSEKRAVPFPSWELTVLKVQYLGLSQAVGIAIASKCNDYVISGIATLSVMVLIVIIMTQVIYTAIHKNKHITFVEKPLSSTWGDFKKDFWAGKGCMGKIKAILKAVASSRKRGEWQDVAEQEEAQAKIQSLQKSKSFSQEGDKVGATSPTSGGANPSPPGSKVGSKAGGKVKENEGEGDLEANRKPTKRGYFTRQFADRYGSTFTDYVGKAWWFEIFLFTKKLLVGLVIGMVLQETMNSALILSMHSIELILIFIYWPFADRSDMMLEIFTIGSRVFQLAGIQAFITGLIKEAQFNRIFLVSSLVGIVPVLFENVIGGVFGLGMKLPHLIGFLGCGAAGTRDAIGSAVSGVGGNISSGVATGMYESAEIEDRMQDTFEASLEQAEEDAEAELQLNPDIIAASAAAGAIAATGAMSDQNPRKSQNPSPVGRQGPPPGWPESWKGRGTFSVKRKSSALELDIVEYSRRSEASAPDSAFSNMMRSSGRVSTTTTPRRGDWSASPKGRNYNPTSPKAASAARYLSDDETQKSRASTAAKQELLSREPTELEKKMEEIELAKGPQMIVAKDSNKMDLRACCSLSP